MSLSLLLRNQITQGGKSETPCTGKKSWSTGGIQVEYGGLQSRENSEALKYMCFTHPPTVFGLRGVSLFPYLERLHSDFNRTPTVFQLYLKEEKRESMCSKNKLEYERRTYILESHFYPFVYITAFDYFSLFLCISICLTFSVGYNLPFVCFITVDRKVLRKSFTLYMSIIFWVYIICLLLYFVYDPHNI
jgi:hypothetical protein